MGQTIRRKIKLLQLELLSESGAHIFPSPTLSYPFCSLRLTRNFPSFLYISYIYICMYIYCSAKAFGSWKNLKILYKFTHCLEKFLMCMYMDLRKSRINFQDILYHFNTYLDGKRKKKSKCKVTNFTYMIYIK